MRNTLSEHFDSNIKPGVDELDRLTGTRVIDVKFDSSKPTVLRYIKCIAPEGVVYRTEKDLRTAETLGLSLRRF